MSASTVKNSDTAADPASLGGGNSQQEWAHWVEKQSSSIKDSALRSSEEFDTYKELEGRLLRRTKDLERELDRLRQVVSESELSYTDKDLTIFESDALAVTLKNTNNLRNLCSEREIEIVRLKSENEALQLSLRQALRSRDLKTLEARNLSTELFQATQLNSDSITEVTALKKRIASLELSAENDRAEINRLQNVAASKTELTDSKKLEFLKQTRLLKRREARIQNFSTMLENQKIELRTVAHRLAEEIQAATTISPLQDYLVLTKLELNKVEVELKKTPGSSLERPRLEAVLVSLVEQRCFLENTLELTRKHLEDQAAAVKLIIHSDPLAPLPPLPPNPPAA